MKPLSPMSVASFLVLALAAPAAFAQASAPAKTDPKATEVVLEEVVVTAQRRAERVQDIPVAVTAFTPSQLEAAQIKETKDLVRYVPSLTGGLNTGTGGAVSYYMRGLGSTEQIATFDVPVATYVDEIYIARQSVNNVSLFDIERTEVLRGPQGTLFGRNTTGGAISIVSRKPGDTLSGFVEGSYGSHNRGLVRGSIDLPLSDKVLTKVSAFYVDDEGYSQSQTTGQKLNGEEAQGARLAVRFLPTTKLTWDVAVDYIDQSRTTIGVNPEDLREYKPRTGLRVGDCDDAIGDYITKRVGNCSNIVTGGLTSNLQYDFDFATLNFITGYRNTNQEFALDFGNVNGAFGAGTQATGAFMLANGIANSQFTQEIKLVGETERVKWVAGAFYLNEENKTEQLQVFGALGGLVDGHWVMKNDATSIAVYAQADMEFSNATTLTVGGRWTTEEKTIDYKDATRALASYGGLGLVSTGALTPPVVPAKTRVTSANLVALGVPLKQETDKFTPRFALSHKISPTRMVFISATNGFKSGGWEARQTDARLIRTFAPEEAWTFEAGLRSELFNRKLRFNATLYNLRVKDIQLISGFPLPGGGITFITQNNGRLVANGVEIETLARPTDNLDLFATLSMSDRKYRSVPLRNGAGNQPCSNTPEPASCITAKDDPVRFPEWQSTFGVRYTQPLAEMGTLSFSASASLSDYYWTSTSNDTGFVNRPALITPPSTLATTNNLVRLSKVPHTTVVNVGMTYRSPNEAFEAALECSNCSDEYYFTSSLVGVGYENDPRRVTARLKYKF
jgi:iron complex outermembrane recepter protein